MTLRIGSSEPLSETSLTDIAVDGVDITVDTKAINFGLIRELETFTSVQTLPLGLSGDFGMINTSNTLNGLMVKGNTYHTKSLSTIHVDSKYQANDNLVTIAGTATSAQGYQGIFSDGKYLFAASPNTSGQEPRTDDGSFYAWDISDPDNPLELFQLNADSSWSNAYGPGPFLDVHGNPAGDGPYQRPECNARYIKTHSVNHCLIFRNEKISTVPQELRNDADNYPYPPIAL